MVGAKTSAEEETRRAFLHHFQILPLTSEVAAETILLRRKYRVKLPDAIIWPPPWSKIVCWFRATGSIFPPTNPACVSLIAAEAHSEFRARPQFRQKAAFRFGRNRPFKLLLDL